MSTIDLARADARGDALVQALPAAEDASGALMQVMASAPLNALRVALPAFVVQAARRLAPDDEQEAINDLYWATLEVIEDEDGPQPEDYTPPPDPEPVVATAEDLALKDVLVAWVCKADRLTLKLSLPLLLAEIAGRFARGCDRLAALEEYIFDKV